MYPNLSLAKVHACYCYNTCRIGYNIIIIYYFVIIADARVPEDDSAYNTFSMTGDSSDSSEPYSEISNIAESGIMIL